MPQLEILKKGESAVKQLNLFEKCTLCVSACVREQKE